MEKQGEIFTFGFMAYGVKVGIKTNSLMFHNRVRSEISTILPVEIFKSHFEEAEHIIILSDLDLQGFEVEIVQSETFRTFDKESAFQFFVRNVRTLIAEFAVAKVVLHAGVVSINGKALLLPAKSRHGKSSLVAALIGSGADYYSDDFAVLDEDGLVHPFPKMISLRSGVNSFVQEDHSIEKFGCQIGDRPVPVGLVLITEFESNAIWDPKTISPSQAIMEILPHTIPIRRNPEFALSVLNKVLSRAIILKSKRPDASAIISYIKTLLN